MGFIRALAFWSSTWFYTTVFFFKLCFIYFRHQKTDRIEKSCVVHQVASEWGRGILEFTPGWSYELRGKENFPKENEPPVVIVANHLSAVDICALFTTGVQFRWLSKASVFRIPMVGTAMRWAGYVPVTRGQRRSHQEALQASAQWLRDGISMVFFPEGSRSLDGELKPFKTGAFRLADQEKTAILPVAIYGTKDMLAKHSLIPNPAKVIVSALPPIWKSPHESIETFTEKVRSLIADEIDKLKMEEQGIRIQRKA